jgi:hypothetical protein
MFTEPAAAYMSSADAAFRLPSVKFQLVNFPELGVRAGSLFGARVNPLLIGGDDRVLEGGARDIKIRILVSWFFGKNLAHIIGI